MVYLFITHANSLFTMSNNNRNSMAEGTGHVQSLLRGLEMLRRLAASDHGLTLRELTEAMGLKQATVYKLLQTLVAAGFAEKTARPIHYMLSAGALELADAYWERSLLQRAEVVMRELFELMRTYNPVVVLAEAIGGEVETVLRIGPERPNIVERPRGRVMPPYAGACTLAFQAFWPAQERDEYQRRHPFWEQGEYLWETPERLDDVLRQTRDQGYALPVFRTKRVQLVAAPIYSAKKQLVAVLGASLSDQDPPDNWPELVREVVAGARRLSASE